MKNNYSIAERNRIVEEHLSLIDKIIRRNVETFDLDKNSLCSYIRAQLQHELQNCKDPCKLTGISNAPNSFHLDNILSLNAMNYGNDPAMAIA